jgi:hypothetical protein
MIKDLMAYNWPIVERTTKFEDEFDNFIQISLSEKKKFLLNLRNKNHDTYSKFIQISLSEIYAYSLGYMDSIVYCKANDDLEIKLEETKIILEREMLEFWLKPTVPPKGMNQKDATEYLRQYIKQNTGVNHNFFNFIEYSMSKEQFYEFLYFETIRNEVVDDEVALIIIGMQGEMKRTIAENLWDECGNGKIEDFHTYWLRRLLKETNMIDNFKEYRKNVPWFTKITSNSFNMLGTRSAYKYRAYGHFLMTESWVNPHFNAIIKGLNRVGIISEDIQVYFTKHYTLDPFHTEDMLKALEKQIPTLTTEEVYEVLKGAHAAVQAGTTLYDYSINYFSK